MDHGKCAPVTAAVTAACCIVVCSQTQVKIHTGFDGVGLFWSSSPRLEELFMMPNIITDPFK